MTNYRIGYLPTARTVNYGGDSGIIINRCTSCHGIWLDNTVIRTVIRSATAAAAGVNGFALFVVGEGTFDVTRNTSTGSFRVSAARIEISAVSGSRISPTITTSGSDRSI